MSTQSYVEDLVEEGSAIALPELTRGRWPAALYRLANRGGIGTIAIPSACLTEEQEEALLRFRFAQYMAAGFVDPRLAARDGMRREPMPAPGRTSASTHP